MAKVDYDSPWKNAITRHPRQALALMFPRVNDHDPQRDHEVLEQELRRLDREAVTGKRILDVLLKAYTHNGDERYLHGEVQSQVEEEFPRRMATYNYRAKDLFGVPVFTFAVLIDADPQWKPNRYTEQVYPGSSTTFRFAVYKILDQARNEEKLLRSDNPFAVVVLAQLYALQTQGDDEARSHKKLALLQHLLARMADEGERREWYTYLDWILLLPEEYNRAMWEVVNETTKEKVMPFVTFADKYAREKGLEEGRKEGLKEGRTEGLIEAIETALQARFGQAGLERMNEIRKEEDAGKLKEILGKVLTMKDLAELVLTGLKANP